MHTPKKQFANQECSNQNSEWELGIYCYKAAYIVRKTERLFFTMIGLQY